MNNLQIFKNVQFGEIRTLTKDGQPWFVGKDIAEVLGYTNPQKAIRDHIDEEDKTLNESFTVNGTKGILINESGLYSLVLSSKLPSAKKFKHWVTSDVLPQIRKTGGYIPSNKNDTDEDIMAKALLIAQRKIDLKDRVIASKDRQLIEQKPKVDFAEHVATANNSMLVREVAKIISKDGITIGEHRLYEKLRAWGFVFKNSCEATQKAIEQGLMEVSEGTRKTEKGTFTYKTSKVTGKGQVYIVNRLKKEREAN